ncbi:hypothetical protein HaLaN_32950, partial [Haematococcus lacustris]
MGRAGGGLARWSSMRWSTERSGSSPCGRGPERVLASCMTESHDVGFPVDAGIDFRKPGLTQDDVEVVK